MRITINSKKLGKTLEFVRAARSGYVYLKMDGQERHICSGGRFQGNTLSYLGDSKADFKALCNRWYRAYVNGVA